MAVPSLDSGFEIDAKAFFSLKNWTTAILPQRRVAREIQGVYLVGSELADDTKAVANPWNTDGSLKAGVAQTDNARLPVEPWPGGALYIFQGTVAEDATVGTHVCTLTVTPGAGNEMLIISARFVAGAGAANLVTVLVDDGTYILSRWANATSLGSGQEANWPWAGATNTQAAASEQRGNPADYPVSGTMRFVMQVSTATVSLTQTFAMMMRVRGAAPSCVLGDTVGTPTLTVNASKFA